MLQVGARAQRAPMQVSARRVQTSVASGPHNGRIGYARPSWGRRAAWPELCV